MPIKIEGTFWTLEEVCKLSGYKYNSLYIRFRKNPEAIRYGGIVLLPDSLVKDFLAAKAAKALKLTAAAKLLSIGVDTLKQLIKQGLPVGRDEQRRFIVLREHIQIFKEVFDKNRVNGRLTKRGQKKAVEEIQKIIREEHDKECSPVNDKPVLSLSGSVPEAVSGGGNHTSGHIRRNRYRRPPCRRNKPQAKNG